MSTGLLPEHIVAPEWTDTTALPVADDGIIVGHDQHGGPVVLRPFCREPVDVVVIGPVVLASTIGLRALAVGATVVVETPRPQAWAGENRQLFPLVPVGGVGGYAGTPDAPLFVISEALSQAQPLADAGPWTARLLLLPSVHEELLPLIRRASLVASAQLKPGSADLLADSLGLPATYARAVTELPSYTCLWSQAQLVRQVATTPTDAERGILRQFLPRPPAAAGAPPASSVPTAPAPSAPPASAPAPSENSPAPSAPPDAGGPRHRA